MASRDERLTPTSLRPALLLLGSFGLLALMLLGLAGSASATHPVDPPSNLTVDPGPYGSATSPGWTYVIPAGQTATCSLAGPATVAVTCPVDGSAARPVTPLPTDGVYTFSVTTTRPTVTVLTTSTPTPTPDAETGATPEPSPVVTEEVHAGATSEPAVSTYHLDTVAPVPTVSTSLGPVYEGWTVGVSAGGSPTTLTCTWTGPAAVPGSGQACSPGTVKPTLSTSGTYALTVTARDAAGLEGAAGPSAFTFDGTAPVVGVALTTSPSPGTQRQPTWSVGVDDATATLTCVLTGPSGTTPTGGPCAAGSFTASTLSTSGDYTLTVTATDPAGNRHSSAATYTLDITPPTVVLPADSTGTGQSVTWQVGVTGGVSTTCTVSGASESTTSCGASGGTATATITNDGTITLTVTAVDALGNTSAPQSVRYTRNTTPTAPVVMADPARGKVRTASWTFTVDTLTTAVTCQVFHNGVAYTAAGACGVFDVNQDTGSHSATLTDDGVYTLHVTASNSTSTSSTTGTGSYTLDTTEPAGPALTQTPSASSGSTAQISWTWNVLAGHTTRCRLSVNGTDGSWATCPGSFSTTATVQGDHTLQVQYRDDLLNEGTISSATYTYDTSAPPTPTVTLVGEQLRKPGPVTWTWTTVDAARSECRVIAPGVDQTTVGWGTCTMPVDLTADGTSTFEVRHYDAADNVSGVGRGTVTLDGTAPSKPSVSATGGRTNTAPLTWTISQVGTDGTSFRCSLVVNGVAGAFATCTSNYSHTPTAQGTYRLDVVSVDAVGNISDVTQGPTWTYDSVGPEKPGVTLEPSSGKTKSATWTVDPADDAARHECRLTRTAGGVTSEAFDWTACAAFTFALEKGDGVYVLHVRSYDDLGNESLPTTGPGYTLDATPPGTPTVTGSRTGPGNATDITYAWTTELGGTASCRLLKGADVVATYANCHLTTPFPVTLSFGDGSYRLEVIVTDSFGNPSGAGLSDPYVLDTVKPTQPSIPAGPPARTTSTSLSWTLALAADDGGARLECRLVKVGTTAGEFGTCLSSYGGLSDGGYRLEVRSVDDAGNRSDVTTSDLVTIDTTKPDAPTVSLTVTSGNTKSATWTVTPSEPGLVECRLTRTADGVTSQVFDWQTCAPDYTYALTADGVYVLHVRSYDDLMNRSDPTQGPGYTLDATAPDKPTVVSSRDGTTHSVREISYSYEGEAGSTARCYLYRDGVLVTPAGATCTATTYTVTLPNVSGRYHLEVTFTDVFLNPSAPGVSGVYTLDVTAPDVPTVTGNRDGQTDNELAVSYSYAGEAGSSPTCRLYRGTTLVTPTGATCTATRYTATLPSTDGTYRLEVTFTDAYGNTSAPGVSGLYTLDVTPPGPATVTVTPRTDNVESATWTVTPPEAGTTSECQLRYKGAVIKAWHPCTAPYTYALDKGDGAYVLEVRVTDAVGNLGPVAVGQDYVVDMTPPLRPVVTSNRTVKDNERSVTYQFSGEGVATCQLTRDGKPVGDPVRGCTTGYTITLPDVSGVYVLLVTYEDAVGNVSDPGSSPAYDLDVTPPAVPVVRSDRTVKDNERVVTYDFSGEGTATCQLMRDGAAVGGAVECTSPWVVTLPTVDGVYVLLVTYTDAVGNPSAAGASPAYELDLTPPPAPVVLGPPVTGNTRTVTWTYSGEGTATCQLLLGGVAFGTETACGATSFSTTLPSDGSWSLRVSFTDAVGNRGPPGTSAAYLLDTVAPVAPGVTGPTGPAQSRSPSWTVSAEAGTTVECRLLRAGSVVRDWSACSGSYGADLTGLPDGGYVVEARATDKAGNLGAVGSSQAYVLDTTAPLAPSVSGPAGPSQSRSPSFSWTGESGTTAQCLLSRDGVTVGGWLACSSGFTPTLDRDGTWTVTVRLTDVAGNVGAPAASGGYVLDTTAPPAPLVTPPQSPGRDLAPSWGAVVEGGTTLECRLVAPDGTSSGWAACTLPHGTPLEGRPDGAYVLEVRATDAAGNLSPVGSGRYVLDTVAPAAAVITSPASPGRTRTPSFSFSTEPASTTRCRLTSGATLISDFAPCTSPTAVDLTGLPDGTYTLTVRVFDAAGNPGPAATGTYVLDTTGPAAPVATLSPGSPSADRTPTWAFSYEPGSTLLCRLTAPGGAVRDVAPCTSPLTVDLTGQPAGTWTLTVRAVDAAGNVGEVLTLTYVLDPTAVSGPDVTGPVSPGSSRTPRWTISTATVTECRLTLGSTVIRDWAACAGSFTADLFGKPDGTYVLAVRTRTATGAYSAPTTSRYVLDTTAPAAATLVGPPTPSTNRQPTWSIASPELGATAECRVLLFGSVLRDWAPCAVSPAGALFTGLDLTGRGDGTYTLVVRLTDAAGNRGPEATSAYVLDTSAPVGVGVTGPPSPGNDPTPTWTFSSPSTVLLECRLTSVDGVVSDWDTCAGSYTADLTGLPDGTYTLAVRAVSAAGTPGPETTSAYVLSRKAPDRPTGLVLSGTGPTGNDRSPTWTFTLPTGTTGRCVVVQGATVVYDGVCLSPFTLDLSNAADGSYTLTVTAVDAAGTASPGVSSTYVLDTVPTAAPVFTQVPGGPGSTLDPQWRFTVVYGATAECRLLHEGTVVADWAACTSPFTATLAGRPDGRYVLEVRAVDAAGNSSPPRSSTYVLDRTAAPIATFTSTPPTPGTDRSVFWTVTAPGGATLECRLVTPDGTSSWQECSTVHLDLANRRDGDYVLEVRVVEADGRRGSVSRSTYTLDTRAPAAPAFSSVPPAAGNDPQPRWSWEATGDERVECRLVRVGGGAVTGWAACTSPYEARLTADGSYALEIRVVDAAGNLSPVTSRTYVYDTKAPAAPVMTSRPPASGADRTVSWTFAVPQGTVATCTVTRGLSRVDERTCNGRYDLDLAGMPDGVYTLTVRFTDAAGNASSPTTSRYTLATVGAGRPGRVDAPSGPSGPSGPSAPPSGGGSTPTAPGGPGRAGTGTVVPNAPQGSTSRPTVPTIPTDTDIPSRSTAGRTSTSIPSQSREEAAAPRPEPRGTPRARNPLLADPLPIGNAPELLREAVTSTITKPTVPLALLAIVILFLVAQNRIDRRDPKLASAPVEAEPELDFTTIVRRPGGALS